MIPASATSWRPVLIPGRNCWTADALVCASGLLIDGRSYYRAFYEAARQARRYLLIAGWRFNSNVRLLRGRDAREAGGDVHFLPFLDRLCAENPELRVYVLAWDFSAIYARKWELFQAWKFQRGSHGRLRFRFDAAHPVGGSHHQKFAVVDGRAAFVGGLDFNADDWDDRRHLAHHPDRRDCGEEPHDPYHDVQAWLTGPAAGELAAHFRARWQTATGEGLELPPPVEGEPPQVRPTVALAARRVALSHTQPWTPSGPSPSHEICSLYQDAIAAAEELIYLENQYFSSRAVFQALLDRIREPGRTRLDIVLVLPKRFPSWIESVTLGPPRVTMLDALEEAARRHGHRLGVYYPVAAEANGCEVPVVVHSKLLAVDDRFLTVGSANTSNRSMGLDTELNVSWEASAAEPELVRSIRQARVSLLAEHCGLRRDAEARRGLRRTRGLVGELDRLARSPAGRLRRLTHEALLEDRRWVGRLARWGFSFDPGSPWVEEKLLRPLTPGPDSVWSRSVAWLRDRLR